MDKWMSWQSRGAMKDEKYPAVAVAAAPVEEGQRRRWKIKAKESNTKEIGGL